MSPRIPPHDPRAHESKPVVFGPGHGPRKLRIWSLSIPGVGTVIRPGRDGFADLPTLRRRTYLRAWPLPFGFALIRGGLDL